MNKILVEIYFPSLAETFDVYIPDRVRFFQIADMLENAVSRHTGGRYAPSGCAILCDRTTGMIYDSNSTAEAMMLHSGSRLMLL